LIIELRETEFIVVWKQTTSFFTCINYKRDEYVRNITENRLCLLNRVYLLNHIVLKLVSTEFFDVNAIINTNL